MTIESGGPDGAGTALGEGDGAGAAGFRAMVLAAAGFGAAGEGCFSAFGAEVFAEVFRGAFGAAGFEAGLRAASFGSEGAAGAATPGVSAPALDSGGAADGFAAAEGDAGVLRAADFLPGFSFGGGVCGSAAGFDFADVRFFSTIQQRTFVHSGCTGIAFGDVENTPSSHPRGAAINRKTLVFRRVDASALD
jgi:hypothetical protein